MPRVVLVARPLWPVLRRVGDLLSRCGYTVETARRIGRPLSCIVTDIDGLRRVNEAYGPVVVGSVVRQYGGEWIAQTLVENADRAQYRGKEVADA